MSSIRRPRWLARKFLGVPAAGALLATLALAGIGGGAAYAASSGPVTQPGACVKNDQASATTARWWLHMPLPAKCPAGSSWWPNFGVQDASGVKSAAVNASGDLIITYDDGHTQDAGHVAGANGTNGTPGANGAPGASAVTNVTAATQISNWPDTGGAGDVWALDNWTRTLSVTVENQVNNSHCNGTPACYAVFGTITDSGTSVPQDGKAAPNNSEPATITAADITQITSGGTASFQFYATSDAINAKNVPATDDAATQGKLASTTDWGELAFPAGTQFFGVALTAYDWNYSAAVSYVNASKTSVSCNQAWNDGINPGNDGQGAADGNITGTCPAS